ncbi:Uncharacterised protein [Candidatus Anstonella stagnisolia]|nr:Uncharacterised protein [Candidatus Anstonella stagnisolia]
MKIAVFALAAVLLLTVSFAACEFNASKALKDANTRLGWYKNHQNATFAKLLLNGKRTNITIDGVSYYAQYKDDKITQIAPVRAEFEAQLDSCTAVGIWNGSISGKTALNKKLVKIKANNFFDGLLLGMLAQVLPS